MQLIKPCFLNNIKSDLIITIIWFNEEIVLATRAFDESPQNRKNASNKISADSNKINYLATVLHLAKIIS